MLGKLSRTFPGTVRKRHGEIGHDLFVQRFNGSPLSGANIWSAVCLETGEFFSGNNDRNFRTRCEALNAAIHQSEEALEELKKRKGTSDFTPATLQELVEYVKGLTNE